MLFRNEYREPMTPSKWIGLICYLIVAGVSGWATAESLDASFMIIPTLVAYLMGFAIVAILGLTLSYIRNILKERDSILRKLLFPVVFFIGLWTFSLATNSHKFFMALKGEDIRKNGLVVAENTLKIFTSTMEAIPKDQVEGYRIYTSKLISNYRKEVANPKNCGHGKVADSLKGIVERTMGTTFPVLSGYNKNPKGCRELADAMSADMHAYLDKQVSSMMDKLQELKNCNDETQRLAILENLKGLNSYTTDFWDNTYKESITEAHQYYNQVFKCYNEGLLGSFNRLSEIDSAFGIAQLEPELELPVPSIRLEKISELARYVRNYPKQEPGTYMNSLYLAILLALVFDLASFITLYYFVLKTEDN